MDWQQIIRQDPYLAGHIAARGYEWWNDEPSAESTARTVGLVEGEPAHLQFIKGWYDCLKENDIGRLKQIYAEQEKAGENYTKGDPEVW